MNSEGRFVGSHRILYRSQTMLKVVLKCSEWRAKVGRRSNSHQSKLLRRKSSQFMNIDR